VTSSAPVRKMDKFLRLPSGELAKLAELQRKEQLKRELGDEPTALLGGVRELILRKCAPDKAAEIRAIFELEFLDTDIFRVSAENCVSFLEPLIESWDVDLATFGHGGAGADGVPAGPCPQRHGDRGGDRVSQAPAVHRQAAYTALLLPGATEPERPPAFSDPAGAGPPLVAEPAGSLSRT